ncbi:MAG: PaaI family thioesterase [Actinobacteria bacterium]|jgi:acyl-coenzyme A thioesterase PaaI-like protein|nr:PaaI family thioesterase [Actinomycetota bacterium]NDA94739.1 PaaI family thioesterase [Actinomycetota bacterium]NDH80849.1 PaaI family thioesterase [Actinomycetota bacterium]NDH99032.1 PaaI family thioesterase [Actinomycetota bacterium]NDI07782.1 PaaI family thioesterase [Actinomycetota bacterium]
MSRVASTTPPEGAVIPERHPEAPATGSKIPSHFAHCFGCGEKHPTGLHLVAHVGNAMNITAEFVVSENHQGAPGLAHGGLLSLAFDEALGKLMWLLRAPAVTARLETDFMKPVPMGSKLYISAEITGQVNRKVYCSAVGRLNSPDGEIAVRAAALFVIVPMSHFLQNAPAEYLEAIAKTPEVLAFVDPNFNINP